MLDALFRTYTVASGTPFPDRLFDAAEPIANGGGRARAWRQASSSGASAVLARLLAAAIRLTRAATPAVTARRLEAIVARPSAHPVNDNKESIAA